MSRDAVASSRLVRAGFWQVTGWSNPVILNRTVLSQSNRLFEAIVVDNKSGPGIDRAG